MLPLARPGLVSLGTFRFPGRVNRYLVPLVLNTDERRYHGDLSGLFAVLTISILPVLAVYLAFHRQISAGMTAGALK